MIYIKEFNIPMVMALTFSFPFILHYISSSMIEQNMQDKLYLVTIVGIFFCLGIIWEILGFKSKEEKKDG
jgi:hypothetical protein